MATIGTIICSAFVLCIAAFGIISFGAMSVGIIKGYDN